MKPTSPAKHIQRNLGRAVMFGTQSLQAPRQIILQDVAMNSTLNKQGVDARVLGTGHIGFKGIAHRQNAIFGNTRQRRKTSLIKRQMRFSVMQTGAAQGTVKPGHRPPQ